jgi:hypothetical protein
MRVEERERKESKIRKAKWEKTAKEMKEEEENKVDKRYNNRRRKEYFINEFITHVDIKSTSFPPSSSATVAYIPF